MGSELTDATSRLEDELGDIAEAAQGFAGLILYPDQLSPIEGERVAGFRPEAQPLRLAAKASGLDVLFARPEGARLGQYTEHSADWVLPLLGGVPLNVIATLVANYLQARLDQTRRNRPDASPSVRYREIDIDPSGNPRLREVEGPAGKIIDWLREERSASIPERGAENGSSGDGTRE